MALATNPVDINRSTTGRVLPADVSAEIFAGVQHESAVMRLARQISVPGRGLSIPVVTGEPIAQIVAETAEKPVSNSTFTTKTMTPKKFAVIELFSNEFKRDYSALYDALVERLPYSIAKAFDNQVFNVAAISGFDSLSAVQAVTRASGDSIDEVVKSGMQLIAADGFRATGFAVSPAYEAELVTATDGINRPLFVQDIREDGFVGRVYGANVAETNALQTMVGGDWSKAVYGIVDGINVEISDQATVNDGTQQINLWQRNMFAVRIEAEIGFVVADTDAFFKVTAA